MRAAAIRIALLALALALATRVLGWVSVPLVALAWGAMASRERAPLDALGAALLAWSGLLLQASLQGPVGDVARILAGVLALPIWAPVTATLMFGATLAWSAAVVGREAARLQRAARRPRPV